MMVADNYMEPVSALPSKPIGDNNNEKDGGEVCAKSQSLHMY